ncbi:MAG: right-handed parallel beta-helix repeat-containing protein [Verrucomicrobia bacterium]|nr:right-handed parallel beta-helix repeat-containing protein [Verrucomicrobiota bacterium]
MRLLIRLILSTASPSLLLIAAAAPANPTPVEFYVAPGGADAWSGTRAEPNAARTDGPFATLARARDAVRGLSAQGTNTRPVTVLIRGGEYRLTQPLVLGPEDSGAPGRPVTYCAHPGERPVFSGGRRIGGWRRGEDGLWSVEVPDARSGGHGLRQLFVNGARRERARWPREKWFSVAGTANRKEAGWAGALGELKDDEWARRSFQFRPGDLRKDWTNLTDVEVVVLQFWAAPRLRIQALDEGRNSVLFTGGSWRPLTWSFGYYVDNVAEGLATPGAWYWNRAMGVLQYRALPGEDLAQADIVAPETLQLVRFTGDADRGAFVHDIVLRGLSFRYTAWELPEVGYHCPQAELPVPAAIQAVGARRCVFENCEVSRVGGWGIELGRGCQDNRITGCLIEDLGAGGIKLGEPDEPGRDVAEAHGNEVSDTRIRHGCKVYLGSPAVWVGQSGGNHIRHNEITGQFMWAVSLGWNWSYFPLNRSRDNVVEKNHIHDLGTGVLGTHGALYCLGVSPGTILRNNYIHHVHAAEAWGAGEGIILDNGCVGILVENNVVHDAVAGGWGCNFNCLGNIIQNNIFVNGRTYQLTRYGDAPGTNPPPNGEVFARNLVVWQEGPLIKEQDWPSFATLWDYNLYWQSRGEPFRFLRYTFAEWNSKGLDVHSVIADPLFVDPAKHDFRLRPESPAFKLGFREIDLHDVGPRPNRP